MIVFNIYTRNKTHQMTLDSKDEAQRIMTLVGQAMDSGDILRLSLRNGQLTVHGGDIISANWSLR